MESHVAGKSVHNERIEHLWHVSHHYYSLFYESGLLDPSNETDIFCLRHVYLVQIMEDLKVHGLTIIFVQNTTLLPTKDQCTCHAKEWDWRRWAGVVTKCHIHGAYLGWQ